MKRKFRSLDRFFFVFSIPHVVRMMLYASLVGIVAGAGAASFFYLLELGTHYCFVELAGYSVTSPSGEELFSQQPVQTFRPWVFFVLPIIGGLLSGLIVYTFAPEAEGHGTDALIEAFHKKRGFIRTRVPFLKALATLFVLCTGGSAGREGPIAQIGGGFGSWLARALHLGSKQRRILLLAGAAGGLGAIFRAPLGGALVAVEVLYREDFETEALLPSILSSVIAYALFSSFFGYQHVFEIPPLAFKDPRELFFYMVLAFVCIPTGILYIKFFYCVRDRFFKRLPFPKHLIPMIGGLLVALLGLFLPGVYGAGWGKIQEALRGEVVIGTMVALAFGKILATSFTIGSGGSGGVFGPTLFIGGMLGGAVGGLGNKLLPEIVAQPEAYVLVGMAAFFAGVANAPIGALLMVAEMTGGYGLIAPLLLVSTIALIFTRRWSIYEQQVQDKFHSPAHIGDITFNLLEKLRVRECYHPTHDLPKFEANMRVSDLPDEIRESKAWPFVIVTDKRGRYVGILPIQRIASLEPAGIVARLTILSEIMEKYQAVGIDDDLFSALRTLRRCNEHELPVMDKLGNLVGYILLEDIMDAYARSIEEKLGSETEKSSDDWTEPDIP